MLYNSINNNNPLGSERKFVILSTVRTMPSSEIERTPSKSWKEKHLGFVIDPHQINVALTRAEEGLIILGEWFWVA